MHLSLAYSLLACTAVHAFSDSSPFVLFSTSELSSPHSDAQLQTNAEVVASASAILSSCPTERYLIVSQPNAHAADIRDGSTCNMPNLCRAVAGDEIRGQFSVAEVVGRVSGESLAERIKAACLAEGKPANVEEARLADLPGLGDEKRKEVLADNDYDLGKLLAELDGDYTVVFFSDRNELSAYEPSFAEPAHIDLKRDSIPIHVSGGNVGGNLGRRADEPTRNLPLFEKYQFFTPGIFMAIIAVLVMLSIGAVGVKALASLEVSYGAFDKEMGPAAQKKHL